MVCFPFTNYHFQMGVTVMGFAEDFGAQSHSLRNECPLILCLCLIHKILAVVKCVFKTLFHPWLRIGVKKDPYNFLALRICLFNGFVLHFP